MYGNMGGYYKCYGFVWCSDLFYVSWCEFENFIFEVDGECIGVLCVIEEGDLLYICDVQIVVGYCGQGVGIYMFEMLYCWVWVCGLYELQLCVFVDNFVVCLYLCMGYQVIGLWFVQFGLICYMVWLV